MPRNYGLTTKVIKSTKFKNLDIQYLRVPRITIVQNLRGPRKYSGREFLPPSRKGAKVMGKGQRLL
jgi:hypothetical protein